LAVTPAPSFSTSAPFSRNAKASQLAPFPHPIELIAKLAQRPRIRLLPTDGFAQKSHGSDPLPDQTLLIDYRESRNNLRDCLVLAAPNHECFRKDDTQVGRMRRKFSGGIDSDACAVRVNGAIKLPLIS
jgi:hypothetical protein